MKLYFRQIKQHMWEPNEIYIGKPNGSLENPVMYVKNQMMDLEICPRTKYNTIKTQRYTGEPNDIAGNPMRYWRTQ